MGAIPTVSVSFKKGDKSRVIVINVSDFDPGIHVERRTFEPLPAPVVEPEPEQANDDAVDITEMTVSQARAVIADASAHELEAFAVAEGSGRARKGVLSAIEKRQNAT